MLNSSKSVEILRGHNSAESAYVVADYPYGFRLRCQIRYWLDAKVDGSRVGPDGNRVSFSLKVRFVSQTSNPKVAGLVWNKPKASVYTQSFGFAVMYKDSVGHVHWASVDFCSWPEHIQAFKANVGALLNAEELEQLAKVESVCRRNSPLSWVEFDAKQLSAANPVES